MGNIPTRIKAIRARLDIMTLAMGTEPLTPAQQEKLNERLDTLWAQHEAGVLAGNEPPLDIDTWLDRLVADAKARAKGQT